MFLPHRQAPLFILRVSKEKVKLCSVLAAFAFVTGIHFAERFGHLSLLTRWEWLTYDARLRLAQRFDPACSDLLAAVVIDEHSLTNINRRFPGAPQWPWPHYLHGLTLKELHHQRPRAIAFDVFFLDQDGRQIIDLDALKGPKRPGKIASGEYFARHLREAGNVILPLPSASDRIDPPRLAPILPQYATNAARLAHAAQRTAHGALNHEALRSIPIYLDDAAQGRIWTLGVQLVAGQLGLRLDQAECSDTRVVIPRDHAPPITIPVISSNQMLVNWNARITPSEHSRIRSAAADTLIFRALLRSQGKTPPATKQPLNDALVVIGSTGIGNNVNDRGRTPIGEKLPFMLTHLNVANSLLTGSVVHPAPPNLTLLIVLALTGVTTWLGWRLRPGLATAAVGLIALGYVAVNLSLFVSSRRVLPLLQPVGGALAITHLLGMAVGSIEQKQRRKVEQAFAKMVSPEIIDQLLAQRHSIPLHAVRRQMTVMFADIRGFTRFTTSLHQESSRTDSSAQDQADAAAFSLDYVNNYLVTIADEVMRHGGTVDKYMGDCVMAFWGAPAPTEEHALKAARCAFAIHRAIRKLNQENRLNLSRPSADTTQRPIEGPELQLGIGINTGMMTAGFMGNPDKLLNYTVFGHEVNIASRLENRCPPGGVLVGEGVRAAIQSSARSQEFEFSEIENPQLKGIPSTVRCYTMKETT